MPPIEDTVVDLVTPIVADLGVELYDIELTGGVLRILLDRSGGVDMGVITDATRRISRALDSADPIPGSYTLEVSSPGIERRLRTPAHFAGAIGERVKVKTKPDSGTDRRFDGVLESFEDRRLGVRTDDGTVVTLSIDQTEKVRTQFVDTAAPKPGQGRKGRRAGGTHRSAAPSDADDQKGRDVPRSPDSTTTSETRP